MKTSQYIRHSQYKKGFIAPLLLALVAILLIGGGAYVYMQSKQVKQPEVVSQTTATSTGQVTDSSNAGWKTYTNEKYGFTVDFPDTLSITRERSIDASDYFELGIGRYFSMRVWGKPNELPNIQEEEGKFSGPYPKQTLQTSVTCAHTIIEKTLSGLKGIEEYGCTGEGHSYMDAFMYKDASLWSISLNPLFEGRLSPAELAELGDGTEIAPLDKSTYDRILSSFRITH